MCARARKEDCSRGKAFDLELHFERAQLAGHVYPAVERLVAGLQQAGRRDRPASRAKSENPPWSMADTESPTEQIVYLAHLRDASQYSVQAGFKQESYHHRANGTRVFAGISSICEIPKVTSAKFDCSAVEGSLHVAIEPRWKARRLPDCPPAPFRPDAPFRAVLPCSARLAPEYPDRASRPEPIPSRSCGRLHIMWAGPVQPERYGSTLVCARSGNGRPSWGALSSTPGNGLQRPASSFARPKIARVLVLPASQSPAIRCEFP